MQEKVFYTKDNIKIAANYYKTNKDSLLIIAPGWFMTKDSKPFKAMSEDFSRDFDVITLDFRGHGKSGGNFTFTSQEKLDLLPILDFAKKSYKQVYLMGFSLGAATAIITAESFKHISKMILVSPPADFNKIENHWWKKEVFIPTLQKFDLKVLSSIRIGNIKMNKVRPIDVIDKITCPTFFLAGKSDFVVYEWHTKSLFDKALCKKQYIAIDNGFHAEDLYINSKSKFLNYCKEWLLN